MNALLLARTMYYQMRKRMVDVNERLTDASLTMKMNRDIHCNLFSQNDQNLISDEVRNY